jgi:hypothetical protein
MDTGIVHKGYPRIKKSCVMNSQCPLFAHSGHLVLFTVDRATPILLKIRHGYLKAEKIGWVYPNVTP